MGYLYLLAAVIGSSSLVILLKVFELKNVNINLGITINYLVGAILAFSTASGSMSAAEIVHSGWFGAAALTGFTFMAALGIFGVSAQRSGVAITTISGRAAVVIPVVAAFIFYNERPTALKLSMLGLIIVAMVLILCKGGSGKGSAAVPAWAYLLPLSVFLANGLSDVCVQWSSRDKLPADSSEIYSYFVGAMFLAGAATGFVFYLIEGFSKKKLHVPHAWDFGLGAILGVMNWVCTMGMFNALDYFEGSVFYPLYYTGAIVVSTVVGVWVFRERLSKTNWIGVAIAITAIAAISMA